MPRTSVTLYPQGWYQFDEPYAGLNWVELSGGQHALAAHDGERIQCTNTSGLAMDSESLAGISLRDVNGNLPVFPADARNPYVVLGYTGFAAAGYAQLAGGYLNTSNGKNYSSANLVSFDTVEATKERPAETFDGDATFAAAAAGQYEIRALWVSRPATDGNTSVQMNAYYLRIEYDYGPDDVPDQFYFNDSTAPINTQAASNVITLSGMTPGAPVTAQLSTTGGAPIARVNGTTDYPVGAFTVYSGDTVQLLGVVPGTVGQGWTATLNINGISDEWKFSAGTDVPQTVTPPGNVTGAIPGASYPNADIGPASMVNPFWQIYNFTAPMAFHFETALPLEWAYQQNGPWYDKSIAGELPATPNYTARIYIRFTAPPQPDSTENITLRYTSQNLASIMTVATGNETTVHYYDLSPIQASQEAVPGWTPTAWYTPTPAGSMNHFSVGTVVTASSSTVGAQAQVTGEWWRMKTDGALPKWPTGTKIVGICCGSAVGTSTSGSNNTIQMQARCQNQATGALDTVLGSHDILNLGNLTDRNVTWFYNGGAYPSAPAQTLPTGWTQQQMHDAIMADAFKWGHSGYIDATTPYLTSTCKYKLLRVYFQITKPPEGMVWEG